MSSSKQYRLNVRTFIFYFLHKATTLRLVFYIFRKWLAIHIEFHLHQKLRFYEFGWERDVYLLMLQKYFYFPISEKKIAKATTYFVIEKLIPGRFIVPGKDLAGTRDILSHSGTVLQDNPGHLVTLLTDSHRPMQTDIKALGLQSKHTERPNGWQIQINWVKQY